MNLHVEPGPSDKYEAEAIAVTASDGEVELNEYGCWRSVHVCSTCGERFTVCPPSTTYGPNCMADDCASYDPSRDASVYFVSEAEHFDREGRS